jgi:flagellar biosynthesis protein FlhA
MKENKKFLEKTPIEVMTALILIVLIFPISALVLDILMVVNLLFALLILFFVIHIRKQTYFSLLPILIFVSIIFSLAVNIITVRLILSKGEAFDGNTIKFFSSFIFDASGIWKLAINAAIFFVIWVIQVIISVKSAVCAAEVANRFILDALQIKLMTIETEYAAESISEDEAGTRKFDVQKEAWFYGAIYGVFEFLFGYEKVKIFFFAVSVIGGILIDILHRGESVSHAIRIYFSLSISYALFFVVHGFLLSIAVRLFSTRTAGKFGQSMN